MTPEERVAQIQQTLEAIKTGWPFFMVLLDERIADCIETLISEDNEQTRGAIKELRRLTELPATLVSERDGIRAGLADEAPAD